MGDSKDHMSMINIYYKVFLFFNQFISINLSQELQNRDLQEKTIL